MLSLHAWLETLDTIDELETLDTIDDLNAYPIEYIIEYVKIHQRSIIKINNKFGSTWFII